MASELVMGPSTPTILSSSPIFLASSTASLGSPLESSRTSSTFLPRTPPFSLTFSMASSQERQKLSPISALSPVTAVMPPMRMVSPLVSVEAISELALAEDVCSELLVVAEPPQAVSREVPMARARPNAIDLFILLFFILLCSFFQVRFFSCCRKGAVHFRCLQSTIVPLFLQDNKNTIWWTISLSSLFFMFFFLFCCLF